MRHADEPTLEGDSRQRSAVAFWRKDNTSSLELPISCPQLDTATSWNDGAGPVVPQTTSYFVLGTYARLRCAVPALRALSTSSTRHAAGPTSSASPP